MVDRNAVSLRGAGAGPSDRAGGYGIGCRIRVWNSPESQVLPGTLSVQTQDRARVGCGPWLEASSRYEWMQGDDRVEREVQLDTAHDVLLAMDVLEHIQNDADALSDWSSFVKPGGYVLVTVPAFQWLWSYHDERLGHVRRHTRSTLEHLAAACGLERIRTRYAFGYVLPLVAIVRKMFPPATESTDLQRHRALVNWLLKRAGQVEAWPGGNRWAGTSVIGIFRKPEVVDVS